MEEKIFAINEHIKGYQLELESMRRSGEEQRELYKYFEAKISGLQLAIEILEGRWE